MHATGEAIEILPIYGVHSTIQDTLHKNYNININSLLLIHPMSACQETH